MTTGLPPGPKDPKTLSLRFSAAYERTPPWDIERPQAALVAIAAEVRGAVLDVGCGTGENALFFAARGHEVVGLDQNPVAIERARTKARARDLAATFETGDAFELDVLGRRFESIIDSGLLHLFDEPERGRLVNSIGRVLKPGGTYHVLCWAEPILGVMGPWPLTEGRLRATFGSAWTVLALQEARFGMRPPFPSPRAWLASVQLNWS